MDETYANRSPAAVVYITKKNHFASRSSTSNCWMKINTTKETLYKDDLQYRMYLVHCTITPPPPTLFRGRKHTGKALQGIILKAAGLCRLRRRDFDIPEPTLVPDLGGSISAGKEMCRVRNLLNESVITGQKGNWIRLDRIWQHCFQEHYSGI